MSEYPEPKQYRGRRPPPLWWFKLKYSALLVTLVVMGIGMSARIIVAIFSGEIPAVLGEDHESVFWAGSRMRFALNLFGWLSFDLLCFGGALLARSRLAGLKGPAAETRL